MVGVETLLPVAGSRIAEVDVPDLEGRTEDVGGGVEHDTVTPADGEHVVVVRRHRSPRPQFMERRAFVARDEALELGLQRLDFGVGEERRDHDEAMLIQGSQLTRRRATPHRELVGSVERDLDAHGAPSWLRHALIAGVPVRRIDGPSSDEDRRRTTSPGPYVPPVTLEARAHVAAASCARSRRA